MGGTHFGLMYLCTALVHANCSLVKPGHPFAVFGAIGRESAMRTSLKGSVVGPRETEVIACGQMWSNLTIAPSTMWKMTHPQWPGQEKEMTACVWKMQWLGQRKEMIE
jgi:hypothetical protein